jgi:hypothetical protein
MTIEPQSAEGRIFGVDSISPRAMSWSLGAVIVSINASAIAWTFDSKLLATVLILIGAAGLEMLLLVAAIRSVAVGRALRRVAYCLGALLLVGTAVAEISFLTDKPKRFVQLVNELHGDFGLSRQLAIAEAAAAATKCASTPAQSNKAP